MPYSTLFSHWDTSILCSNNVFFPLLNITLSKASLCWSMQTMVGGCGGSILTHSKARKRKTQLLAIHFFFFFESSNTQNSNYFLLHFAMVQISPHRMWKWYHTLPHGYQKSAFPNLFRQALPKISSDKHNKYLQNFKLSDYGLTQLHFLMKMGYCSEGFLHSES